jgi:hypothetical protein
MKKSTTNRSRISSKTRLRKAMPNAVFGAKDEAHFVRNQDAAQNTQGRRKNEY